MDLVITPVLLASTGIDIPDEQVVPFLSYMNNSLEERVGETVIALLDDSQLEQLANLQEIVSDEEIQNWISANVKDLADIVQDEIDILLGEAAEHSAEFSAQ